MMMLFVSFFYFFFLFLPTYGYGVGSYQCANQCQQETYDPSKKL